VFLFAVSLFIAFLLAGVMQRVLLGQYGFSLGPLTVPEITGEQVMEAADSMLAGVPRETTVVPGEDGPEPVWATVNDPNLALAGWRIDIEKELKRISREFHTPPAESRNLGRLLISLSLNGAIEPEVVPGLRNLLDLANRGVHGALVDQSVLEVLRTEGLDVLQYLRSVRG
jgi:hypothetical protein